MEGVVAESAYLCILLTARSEPVCVPVCSLVCVHTCVQIVSLLASRVTASRPSSKCSGLCRVPGLSFPGSQRTRWSVVLWDKVRF